MIENIHSNEGEDQGSTQRFYSFKPPKNIKQIGESTSQKKIYVEDYAFTYMKELVKKEYEDCRVAVLLGKYVKTQDTRILLINGAIEAEGIEFDSEHVFNNDTWTTIYENIKRYFNEVEVVGWFIGGPGFLLENEEKLKKIHLDNFAGVDKALLKYDSLEGEEAFYIYEHGALNKQSGYYIYYDKNDDMQNYIMEHKPLLKKRSGKEKEQAVVKEYKEEIKEQKANENNKNILHLMYAAGSLMVVIIIVAFAAMINNTSRIHQIEQSLDELSTAFAATEQLRVVSGNYEDASSEAKDTLEVETISGSLNSIKSEEVIGDKAEDSAKIDGNQEIEANKDEVPSEDKLANQDENSQEGNEQSSDKEDSQEEVAKVTESLEQESSSEKPEAQEASATTEVNYYEVQKGDTLVGISFKLYNSGEYVRKIMELNGIEDMDTIYYGQKLIVP